MKTGLLKIESIVLCLLVIAALSGCGKKSSFAGASSAATSVESTVSGSSVQSETQSENEGADSPDTVVNPQKGNEKPSENGVADSSVSQSVSSASSGPASDGSASSYTPFNPADAVITTFYLETEKSGNTLTVNVKIVKNIGFAGFDLSLDYDKNVLTPKKVTNGIVSVTSNWQDSLTATGKAAAVYVAARTVSGDGTLCSFTFDIADKTAISTSVSFAPGNRSLIAIDGSFISADKKDVICSLAG